MISIINKYNKQKKELSKLLTSSNYSSKLRNGKSSRKIKSSLNSSGQLRFNKSQKRINGLKSKNKENDNSASSQKSMASLNLFKRTETQVKRLLSSNENN